MSTTNSGPGSDADWTEALRICRTAVPTAKRAVHMGLACVEVGLAVWVVSACGHSAGFAWHGRAPHEVLAPSATDAAQRYVDMMFSKPATVVVTPFTTPVNRRAYTADEVQKILALCDSIDEKIRQQTELVASLRASVKAHAEDYVAPGPMTVAEARLLPEWVWAHDLSHAMIHLVHRSQLSRTHSVTKFTTWQQACAGAEREAMRLGYAQMTVNVWRKTPGTPTFNP